MTEIASVYRNKYGGTVKFGLSSPGYNILSKKTNADLCGRKKGMPYNTHISCLDATYTELVNFGAKLDYKEQRFNGNVIDFFVASSFLTNNKEKFEAFLKNAIKCGFFQMHNDGKLVPASADLLLFFPVSIDAGIEQMICF